MTTTTNNQRIRSPSLAKYIKNVRQANERTAEQYEYRLSKFEKYLATVYEEEQQQQQQQNQELTVLDQVIDKLKSGNNNKINSYDLLSGFVAYLQEVEDQIKIIRCIFISLLPLSHYLFEEEKVNVNTIMTIAGKIWLFHNIFPN